MSKLWYKIKNVSEITIILTVVLLFIAGLIFMSYELWKAQHPDAPSWTSCVELADD